MVCVLKQKYGQPPKNRLIEGLKLATLRSKVHARQALLYTVRPEAPQNLCTHMH